MTLAWAGRWLWKIALASGLALTIAGSPGAKAGESFTADFDISAGPLDKALVQFAQQSGGHVFYSPALVAHRQAPTLKGNLALARALSLLLKETDLTAVAVNTHTYVIQPASRPRAATTRQRSRNDTSAGQPTRSDTIDLVSVQVTGSRIPRTSFETTVPVTVITREQIDTSGFVTLFDLLRYQPGMVGHHAIEAANEGRSQSLTSIIPMASAHAASLYGLGPRGTLYLIDGKRVTDYALPSSAVGGVTDLGGIPLSMVERVEIQRGGASAVYGSDALAGVVNIILKRDYVGAEASALYGISGAGDAQVSRVSSNMGFKVGRSGYASINLDGFRQEHLEGGARDWHTDDRRADGLPNATEQLGYYLNFASIEPFPACSNAADSGDPACRFDRGRYQSLVPGVERRAASLSFSSSLPKDTQLRVDLRYTSALTRLDSAPMFLLGNIVPPSDPHYEEGAFAQHAFYELGPISSHARSRSTMGSIGLAVPAGRWTIDVEALAQSAGARNEIYGVVDNLVLSEMLAASRYRIDGQPNDPGVLAVMAPPLLVKGAATLSGLTIRGHGQLGEIDGRPLQLAAGLEYQRDSLELTFDPSLFQPGYSYVGDARDYRGDRMRQGLYAEAVVPLQFSVSIEAAWRLDRIERDAASSPRIGTTWRPTDRLLVRGSMGRSFRSPSLLELNVVPADLYAGVTVSIPNTPGLPECGNPTVQGRCLVEIRTAANQNLQPERALFQGLGAVWQPANGLDMAIDYYRIVRKDEIALVTAQGLVSSPQEFPESWGMDETGRLQSLDVKHLNIAKSDIRGVYADATWRLRPAAWGALTVRVTGSHVLEADFSAHDGRAMDRVGHRAPATAGTTSLQWAQGAWAASAHLRHFSGYAIHDTAAPCPTGNVAARHCRNPSITTVAIGASYASPSGWRASAFVNNLTDHQPVDYDTARSGYNPSLDEPIGRSYLLRLDYPF